MSACNNGIVLIAF